MLSSSVECTSHGVLGMLNFMFPLAFVVSVPKEHGLSDNYSTSVCSIWDGRLPGFNHLTSNKHEWNNCFILRLFTSFIFKRGNEKASEACAKHAGVRVGFAWEASKKNLPQYPLPTQSSLPFALASNSICAFNYGIKIWEKKGGEWSIVSLKMPREGRKWNKNKK